MFTLSRFLGNNTALMLMPKKAGDASVKAPRRSPVISYIAAVVIGSINAPIHTVVSMKPIAVAISLGLVPENLNGTESVIGQKVQAAPLAVDIGFC